MVNVQLDSMFDYWIKQRTIDRKRRKKLAFSQMRQQLNLQL